MKLLLGIIAVLLLLSGRAEAVTCGTVPYIFTDGTIADANQVNADFSAVATCTVTEKIGVSPMAFGAVGNGTTNDTVAVLAAGASAITRKLPLLIDRFYKTSALDFTAGSIQIVGTGRGGFPDGQQTNTLACPSGFIPTTTNIDGYIKLTGGSSARDFCLKMNAAGTNASGRAITNETVCDTSGTCPLGHDVTISNVLIDGPCIGISLSGSYVSIVGGSFIANLQGTGCGGVKIGTYTNSNRSVQPHIDNLTTFGVYGASPAAEYGLWLQDAGGPILTHNALQTTKVGLLLKPGVDFAIGGGQNIQGINSSNNYWGDTVNANGILIDTSGGAVGFTLGRNTFVNDWVSGGTDGVVIQNTAGGGTLVGGFTFANLRATGTAITNHCISIQSASVFDIAIFGLDCRNVVLGGVNVSPGIPEFTASGNSFRNDGTFTPSTMPYCFNFGASLNTFMVSGNNLSYCTTPFAGTTPSTPGAGLIRANQGVDNFPKNVTAATNITLDEHPIVNISGATNISHITGDPNMQYTFVCNAIGGVLFDHTAGGSNLFNDATCNPTIFGASFVGSTWVLK